MTVPDLVGMEVESAWMHGHDVGVAVSSADPDGPPVHGRGRTGVWFVVAQHPPAGTEVLRWAAVVVDVEESGGGDAGDRKPRVPRPDPLLMRAARRPGDDEAGSAGR